MQLISHVNQFPVPHLIPNLNSAGFSTTIIVSWLGNGTKMGPKKEKVILGGLIRQPGAEVDDDPEEEEGPGLAE